MKKVAFVALVLFGSLIILQYVLMRPMLAPISAQDVPNKVEIVQPVNAEIFQHQDYIVVYKDGRYFVYRKNLPAT